MFSTHRLKKKIAIWTHGAVGSGLASQGQPAIMRLIEWLSIQYSVEVYSLLPPNDHFTPRNYVIHSTKKRHQFLRWVELCLTFLKNHREERYDCLYSFWGYPSGVVAYFIGKLMGIPSILHLQGGDSVAISEFSYGVFQSHSRAKIARYVYNRCDVLIALTEFQKSFLISNGVKRNVIVIPYGVDPNVFSFREPNLNEKIKFLHIGNLTPIKGQQMMLKTFATICVQIKAELTIVGPDYNEGSLVRLAAELNITNKVNFAGHQLYLDLPFIYHNSHVLIHTSVYEGQGVVFSEAASCGTLIAGTKVGLLADMNDDCGIRVDYGQHELLASRIIDTLKSRERFIGYIRSAKAWIHTRDEQNTFQSIGLMIDKTIRQF